MYIVWGNESETPQKLNDVTAQETETMPFSNINWYHELLMNFLEKESQPIFILCTDLSFSAIACLSCQPTLFKPSHSLAKIHPHTQP